jgi:hypothetical protein
VQVGIAEDAAAAIANASGDDRKFVDTLVALGAKDGYAEYLHDWSSSPGTDDDWPPASSRP